VADLEFNLTDVTSLATKLSGLQQDLTQQEHALLLAIFAAAAARATVTDASTSTSTLPQPQIVGQATGTDPGYTSAADLQNQLLNAYIPGNYFDGVNSITEKTVGSRTQSARTAEPPANQGGQPVT
jgi:hypothetical protein